MKLCKNCTYKRRNLGAPLCKSPKAPFELNKINGIIEPNFCSIMRISNNDCGDNANWFKPRKWYQL